MTRRLRGRATRGERGAAAVEFALVCIPALILIMGAMQFGWYFYVSQSSSGAANTVTRKLAVGDCWASGAAQTFARNQSRPDLTLTTSPTSISSTTPRGTAITVTVTAPADVLGLFPMPNGGVITKTVTTRLEDTEPGTPAC